MERGKTMIPERFQDYFFNDRDYLPETYEVEDKEREKLIRQLAALITDDLGMAGKPNKISNDEPDFWLLDKLLTTEEVKFMLNFKKKRTVKLNAAGLAKRNKMSVEEATEMAEGICRKMFIRTLTSLDISPMYQKKKLLIFYPV